MAKMQGMDGRAGQLVMDHAEAFQFLLSQAAAQAARIVHVARAATAAAAEAMHRIDAAVERQEEAGAAAGASR